MLDPCSSLTNPAIKVAYEISCSQGFAHIDHHDEEIFMTNKVPYKESESVTKWNEAYNNDPQEVHIIFTKFTKENHSTTPLHTSCRTQIHENPRIPSDIRQTKECASN